MAESVATEQAVSPQTIDLMAALKDSLAKNRAELEQENEQLRAEIVRLRGAMEDGADEIVRLSEALRIAEGRIVIRDSLLDGNYNLSQKVAEARAAIRSTEAL